MTPPRKPRIQPVITSPAADPDNTAAVAALLGLDAAALLQLWRMETACHRTRTAKPADYIVELLQVRARGHRINNLAPRPAELAISVQGARRPEVAPRPAAPPPPPPPAARLEQRAIEARRRADIVRERLLTWPPKVAIPASMAEAAAVNNIPLLRADGSPIEIAGQTAADAARGELAQAVQELEQRRIERQREQAAARRNDPARLETA